MTPSERTGRYYRSRGYSLQRVERWVRSGRGGYRKDFLGIIDFLALQPGLPIIGVQSCGQAFVAHAEKLRQYEDVLRLWLSTGSRFELIGWRCLKSGYEPRIRVYKLPPGIDICEGMSIQNIPIETFDVTSGSQDGSGSKNEDQSGSGAIWRV